jgi:hypothetical protein
VLFGLPALLVVAFAPTLLSVLAIDSADQSGVTTTEGAAPKPPSLAAREKLLRHWFGEAFVPLTTDPTQPVSSDDDASDFTKHLSAFHEFEFSLHPNFGPKFSIQEGDEFGAKDWQRLDASFKSGKATLRPVRLTSGIEKVRYDFADSAFIVTFSDAFLDSGNHVACNPTLSVWKPIVASKMPRWCHDIFCVATQNLPKTFRTLSLKIPMSEERAKSWKQAMGAPNADVLGSIEVVVTVQPSTRWFKSWMAPLPSGGAPIRTCYGGWLVRVHGFSISIKTINAIGLSTDSGYRWSFPKSMDEPEAAIDEKNSEERAGQDIEP